MKLKLTDTLSAPQRISSVDIFRSVAIISVAIFHYGTFLPLGYIGVDLFFVISGLLVGGLLTKEFMKEGKINYLKFILQRGLKIWPSYYTFFLVGTGVAILLYSDTHPDQIIPLWDIKRYLLFYQNYTGLPLHLSFDHVWSLCIEEHFYIILPLLFIFIRFFIKADQQMKYLVAFVCITIGLGIVMKAVSFYFTRSMDTYSGTHNRIDALAWGVLLSIIITHYGDKLVNQKKIVIFFFAGLILLLTAIALKLNLENIFFNKIIFHSLLPLSFFMMILGVYYVDFRRLKILRIVSYFSYNWYLWHALFSIYLFEKLGNSIGGLITYLIVTFFIAVVATILIEETVLEKRNFIISKIIRQ